jgi:diaminohydroxyphosphoribosylaminopyrimidine deaminase/5-amino-6-(5-phosphoribosylamino)uracil reductase
VVACTGAAPAAREQALARRGVRIWRLPGAGGRVSPRALARRLAREGCHEVLLEGGPALGSAFLSAGLVQRLVLYAAPMVLGGGRAWCEGLELPLAAAARGTIHSVGGVGADLRLVVDLGD